MPLFVDKIIVVCHNIRSAFNIGSIFRTADGAGDDFGNPLFDLIYQRRPSTITEVNWPLPNRYRADMIAANETIKASSAGQDELWRQAVAEGYLDKGRTREIWIPTPDEKTCSICLAIPRMNPDGVPLGGMFQSPVGPVRRPGDPHVRCRCGKSLLVDQGRGFQVPPFVRQMAEAA